MPGIGVGLPGGDIFLCWRAEFRFDFAAGRRGHVVLVAPTYLGGDSAARRTMRMLRSVLVTPNRRYIPYSACLHGRLSINSNHRCWDYSRLIT